MAERDLVQLESELKTTETLQPAASMYQSNKWHVGWGLPQPENLHPDRRCPCFRKKVMKGSMHHLPQSVICIPTHFMQAHPDTFQQGNLITLEGPSGNTWKVRATGRPILHSGWRAFAHDHDLHEGDELCFMLTRPLHFVVEVLNRHGIVKESALTATNTGTYTVASVCYPYEYVHRPRKRKGSKISATYHEDFGYGVPAASTIASRCKTTARERSGGYNSYPNRLRFSHKRKQWECREETDGREVVTILDSDEEEEEKHLLDHIELSFGSAQVQSYRMSKIQRLVAYMKQQGEFDPPRSNPAPVAVEDQRTVATQTIPAQEIAGHGEELKVAENVDHLHPEAAAEVTTNQAQVSRDEDTIMSNKEEKDTHLPRLVKSDHDMQLQITPETNLCAEALPIPTASLAAEHKSVQTVGPLTEKTELLPPTKGHEVLTSGGDCLFATLQNIVDIPVIADTIINADPIREHRIHSEPAVTSHELIKSEEPEPKEITMELQSSSAAKLYKQCEFPMTKILNGNPGISKTSTTACVLKSKRMQVAKLHRAKTLRAAQAMTKKLRSPTFVAVMKSCNVYTDFTMDIPAEFGKRSRLPATEAKVTLVCDEVPTMCKAMWIGTNPEKPKLDAEAWMEFSRSHFLEEGDVCVFELFNRVTIRIGIHIFRVVGLSRSLLPAHWTQHYKVVHLDAHHPPSCAAAALPLRSVELL